MQTNTQATDSVGLMSALLTSIQRTWHSALVVELLILAVTAPLLYFSGTFGPIGITSGLALLAGGWMWRRVREGVWYEATPADWPILLLVLVMLPAAVWAAPEPLRSQYAWPRAYVLLWNAQLFAVVVTYASRHQRLLAPALVLFAGTGLVFALVAPLGTNWLFKLPGTEAILSRFPSVMSVASR